MKRFSFLLATALSVFGTQAIAQTTLSATHDAYVRDGSNANNTYGSKDANNLMAKASNVSNDGYSRITYLKFDISGVASSVSLAKLRLYGNLSDNTSPNKVTEVYSCSNTSWTESAITWNNKPANNTTSLASVTVTNATAQYYEWDVTSYIAAQKAASATSVTLVLINSSVTNGPYTRFNSDEASSNKPQLVVTATTGGGGGGGSVCTGCPSDNPYRTKYPSTPANHWTDSLKFGTFVVNIGNYAGTTTEDKLAAAQADVVANGGGIIFFPSGTYTFTNDVKLLNGVILRGATPSITDAKNSAFAPPTRFTFPQYVPTFTGSGTANSTAFKNINSDSLAQNTGVVFIDINRAGINLMPNFASKAGFTSPQITKSKRNLIVFGVRNNNVSTPDPSIPATGQNAWQRFSFRFGVNINVYATKNAIVNNNRINDLTNNTAYPIASDNYNQPGYIVTGTFNGPTSAPTGASASGTTTISDGTWAPFEFAGHYGIQVNRGKSYVTFGTPATEPNLFCTGIEVSDNWVFKTRRIGIVASGEGLVMNNNIIKDQTGKRNFLSVDGKKANTNNAITLENRGMDWSGHNVTISNNDVEVFQHASLYSGYFSVDGEGILIQECCGGSSIDGATITYNTMRGSSSYIGLYKVRDILNINISNNDFTNANGNLGVYINANTNSTGYKLQNVTASNNVGPKGFTAAGNITGSNVVLNNNSGSGNFAWPCYATQSGNTGFTIASCTPSTARLGYSAPDIALAKTGISIYPNPANANGITLDITNDEASTANVTITNAIGQICGNTVLSVTSGTTQHQIATANLAIGIYFVKVSAGALQSTQRLEISR